MENETNETWRDRKRRELMEKQMKMAYEVARISIEIKKLREEPPVPEGSVPLSMIEPLINETVERLMLLKEAKKPKPKRVTRDLILDAIGCPNLALVRWVRQEKPRRGPRVPFFRFIYLKEEPRRNSISQYSLHHKMVDAEIIHFLDVDQRNLKDLTLEQWVHHGLTLIEQVMLRRDLSSAIEAVSPSETPFSREAREMNVSLHEWEVAKAKYIPKPKRVTRAAIIDAIGCPNLVLERVNHRDVLAGEHTVGFAFSYLKEGMYGDYEVLGQLEVDHPRLKDLTLEQWVENGQLLVDQVENT